MGHTELWDPTLPGHVTCALSEPQLPDLQWVPSFPWGLVCEAQRECQGTLLNQPGLSCQQQPPNANGTVAPKGILAPYRKNRADLGFGWRECSDHLLRILPLSSSGLSLPLCWQNSQATMEARWPLAPLGFQAGIQPGRALFATVPVQGLACLSGPLGVTCPS